MYYILDEQRQPRMTSVQEMAAQREEQFEDPWRVGDDEVGERRVSTVFLGLDHSWGDDSGDPVLFETMVFPLGSYSDEYCWRGSTYAEALEHHKLVVDHLRAGLPLEDLR